MNYLDLLPSDVMNVINRNVQDSHMIERRKERKEKWKMNREQKRKAERKRYINENMWIYVETMYKIK